MTYKTRFCPRTFPDIPFTGKVKPDFTRRHWCIDCWWILTLRRLRFWWTGGLR